MAIEDTDLRRNVSLLKGEARAVEYRTKAREALAAAEIASLEQVRQQYEVAASVWAGLAESEERRAESHMQRALRAGGLPNSRTTSI